MTTDTNDTYTHPLALLPRYIERLMIVAALLAVETDQSERNRLVGKADGIRVAINATLADLHALEAVSEGRRRELDRLEAAHRAEWQRAERAEAERDDLRTIIRLARERLYDAHGRGAATTASVIRIVGQILRRAREEAADGTR